MRVFEKKYDGEEICDIERDMAEAFDAVFNPLVADIPQDKNGIQKGTFKVTIEWQPEEE